MPRDVRESAVSPDSGAEVWQHQLSRRMTDRLLRDLANRGWGMPNIEVGPESLRAAAKGSQEVAGELRAANPRAIDAVKRAMPGSRAAGHADDVSDIWERKLKKLSTALDERADKLDAAAKLYDSGERNAEEDFRRMKPRDPEAKWPR